VLRVLPDSGARGRLDVALTRGLIPLVGRESEVTLLQERWAQAKGGQGQVVYSLGMQGIGKEPSGPMLKEHIAQSPQCAGSVRECGVLSNTAPVFRD